MAYLYSPMPLPASVKPLQAAVSVVVDAVKSTGNTVKLGKAINTNHNIYVVFDQELNFSTQLGVQVHGIIGYEFFKDFVVDLLKMIHTTMEVKLQHSLKLL